MKCRCKKPSLPPLASYPDFVQGVKKLTKADRDNLLLYLLCLLAKEKIKP